MATVLFASCSSDEPALPSAERLERDASIDIQYSRALSGGLASATYKLSEYYVFDQSILTNGKWVYKDMSDYVGWSLCAPSTIIIEEGKVYTTYRTFNSTVGTTLIGQIWNAYLYTTKQKLTLCIARRFEINDEDNSVFIGETPYIVQGATKDSFQLEHISQYDGGESGQGGYHKEITIHKAVSHQTIGNNILAFESEQELVKDVINRARAIFGDVVDLNDIYKGYVIYDEPERYIFNLDEVARHYGVE